MTSHRPGADDKPGPRPRTVRLPAFVSDEPVGLGDVIKRATSAAGLRPCGGCADRAAWLNSRVVFARRRK